MHGVCTSFMHLGKVLYKKNSAVHEFFLFKNNNALSYPKCTVREIAHKYELHIPCCNRANTGFRNKLFLIEQDRR